MCTKKLLQIIIKQFLHKDKIFKLQKTCWVIENHTIFTDKLKLVFINRMKLTFKSIKNQTQVWTVKSTISLYQK